MLTPASADVRERGHLDAYQGAYERAIRTTATPHAPWHAVPADSQWYPRLVVVAAVVQALKEMDLAYPRVGEDKRHEPEAARTLLDQEG
jgi:polyphosphate kinase 2 (PPK2 family)